MICGAMGYGGYRLLAFAEHLVGVGRDVEDVRPTGHELAQPAQALVFDRLGHALEHDKHARLRGHCDRGLARKQRELAPVPARSQDTIEPQPLADEIIQGAPGLRIIEHAPRGFLHALRSGEVAPRRSRE